jgi:hypothetical protein
MEFNFLEGKHVFLILIFWECFHFKPFYFKCFILVLKSFSLCLDPLFWECILENAFLLECILENAFSRMHIAENSVFGKILKLFIKSDYAKRNYILLIF